MRNWDSSDENGSNNCPITQDLIDMKEVCKVLKIPSHEVRIYSFLFFDDFFLSFLFFDRFHMLKNIGQMYFYHLLKHMKVELQHQIQMFIVTVL